jgi:hypothetical protein
MTKNTKEIGNNYYTSEGREVNLVAFTTNGKFVIVELRAFDYETGPETIFGATTLVDALFDEPPKDVFDKEIAALTKEVQALKKMKNELYVDAVNAEFNVRERLEKIKKYKGLERIEDFIEGRITHVVLEDYADWHVVPLSALEDKSDSNRYRTTKALRLVCLFGDSKGDLSWCVGNYKEDTNSGWKKIVPCASEEEAIEKRRELIAADIVEKYSNLNQGYLRPFDAAVACAIKYGVTVANEHMAAYRDHMRLEQAKMRANLEKTIAEAKTKLNALDATVFLGPQNEGDSSHGKVCY